MATRDVFSEQEMGRLRGFPEITRAELIRYFTLTNAEEEFLRKFLGPRNVLGASVRLCVLPWLGFVPDEVSVAPVAVVDRLVDRLEIPGVELRGYGERAQTRTDHLREIVRYLGWRSVGPPEWKELDEFLFARAMEHDSPKLLFGLACEFLISERVVRPGVVHLLEHVAAARERARRETWTLLAHLLSDSARRAELDALLVVDATLGRTPLAWLGAGPTTSSPAAVKAELAKLAYLRGLDAHTLDLSVLPARRRRFLAGLGQRLTGQALARREPERRYPILLTLLAESVVDVLDEVVLLFDQALSGRESNARTRLTEELAERARSGEDRQALLDEILAITLDLEIADADVGGLVRTRMGMERMREAWAARRERLPRDPGSSISGLKTNASGRQAGDMVTSSGQNPSIRSPHSRNDQHSRFPLPWRWRALAKSAPLRMKKRSWASSLISAGNPDSCSPCAFDRNGPAPCRPYNRHRGATHPTITLIFSPQSATRGGVVNLFGPASGGDHPVRLRRGRSGLLGWFRRPWSAR